MVALKAFRQADQNLRVPITLYLTLLDLIHEKLGDVFCRSLMVTNDTGLCPSNVSYHQVTSM